MKMIPCDNGGCKNHGYLIVTWGTYADGGHCNESVFCREHVKVLWDKMRGHLMVGSGFWSNKAVPIDDRPRNTSD